MVTTKTYLEDGFDDLVDGIEHHTQMVGFVVVSADVDLPFGDSAVDLRQHVPGLVPHLRADVFQGVHEPLQRADELVLEVHHARLHQLRVYQDLQQQLRAVGDEVLVQRVNRTNAFLRHDVDVLVATRVLFSLHLDVEQTLVEVLLFGVLLGRDVGSADDQVLH